MYLNSHKHSDSVSVYVTEHLKFKIASEKRSISETRSSCFAVEIFLSATETFYLLAVDVVSHSVNK